MRTTLVLAVAFLAGAGTMSVELAAVRLIAPWYGTSVGVWTNVIGVILLALSGGYLLGARLAAGGRPLVRLGLMLLFGAASCAWLPALAQPLAEYFVPPDLALGDSAELFEWGSLATSLLLFLPPAAALGTAAPLATEALAAARSEGATPGASASTDTTGAAGSAGGRVLAASTLGSLVGTFGTTHVALPQLGLVGTFTAAAAGLVIAGLVSLVVGRGTRLAAAVGGLALVAAGAAFGYGGYERPQLSEGQTLLASGESAYQSVRVVADAASGMRFLQVNEATDSFQSVWQPETGLLPEGFYYNHFALPAWWEAQASAAGAWRCAVLGLGAGTATRVLEGTLPAARSLELVGVELDPLVVELAAEHLDLELGPERIVMAGLDARRALASLARQGRTDFDQLILDAYANQVEIPAHLSSLEFFREVRSALAPSGWLSVNVGAFSAEDPVLLAVAETAAAAFEKPVLGLRVPSSRNWVLFVRRTGPLVLPGGPAWTAAEPLGRLFLAPLEVPSARRVFDPPAQAPLTDDRNAIERLQRRAIELASQERERA